MSPVDLRELGPDDGQVLDRVFAGLSDESRYLRYLAPMPVLPPTSRRILTAVDGTRHQAVGAFVRGEPIGIARLIALDSGRAELALEVVDAWQGRGVGTQLGRWVADRAVQLGYTELVAETAGENRGAHALLRKLVPDLRTTRDGRLIVFTLPLPVASAAAA